jgi:2-polyprenyl-3-methyl-5-hydroxy-6-metoxy-1,4-benzoquinol methylase
MLLARRPPQAEIMDEPDLDPAVHDAALDGLARLNAWAGSARPFWPPLAALARGAPGPLHVLDVAAGAGDVAVALARRARRAGLPLRVTATDRSATALAHAARRAARHGVPLEVVQADALAPGGLPLRADAVICSLFLHHLDEERAVAFLRAAAAAARRLLLVADLRRSAAGLLLAAGASHLATRSPVVHADAASSVRNAYAPREVAALAARAGLARAVVRRTFPQRLLLAWSPA